MVENGLNLVRNWLTKALRDLKAAKTLSADPKPLLDAAIFHCQQAAEKAVKGYLVYRDIRFLKTHDVRSLVMAAASVEPSFSSWLRVGEKLTPYIAEFRYPAEADEPTRAEFDEALCSAQALYEFVLSLLPKEAHPME